MKSAIPVAEHSGQVTSTDGTIIGYRQMGQGPGLVIVHGGLTTSRNYLRLAEALADTFTVYLPDRRGRGRSGPQGANYSATKECEDLGALLHQTGSRLVFGHSAGGLLALEAALVLPIEKLALYEPAVSIQGSIPVDWVPAFEQAVASHNAARALALALKGLQLNRLSRALPLWVLSLLARLLLRDDESGQMWQGLSAAVGEMTVVRQLESHYEYYRSITAQTLLLLGSRSPAFLREVLPILAATIPQATLVEFPRLGHNAPDLSAPQIIAGALRSFLVPNSTRDSDVAS